MPQPEQDDHKAIFHGLEQVYRVDHPKYGKIKRGAVAGILWQYGNIARYIHKGLTGPRPKFDLKKLALVQEYIENHVSSGQGIKLQLDLVPEPAMGWPEIADLKAVAAEQTSLPPGKDVAEYNGAPGQFEMIVRGRKEQAELERKIREKYQNETDPKKLEMRDRMLKNIAEQEKTLELLQLEPTDPAYVKKANEIIDHLKKIADSGEQAPDGAADPLDPPDGRLAPVDGGVIDKVGHKWKSDDDGEDPPSSKEPNKGLPPPTTPTTPVMGPPVPPTTPPAPAPVMGPPLPPDKQPAPVMGPPAPPDTPPAPAPVMGPPPPPDKQPAPVMGPPAPPTTPPAPVMGPPAPTPLAGGIDDKTVTIARAEAAAHAEAMTAEFGGLLTRYRQNALALTRRLAALARAAAVIPPARPAGYKHGVIDFPYTIDVARLRALGGKKNNDMDTSLEAAFGAVRESSPELASFYATAVEGGLNHSRIYQTMLLFGRWKHAPEPLAAGDIVYLANPMVPGGGGWGVVIEANGVSVSEALVHSESYGDPFMIRKGFTGTVTKSWCPAPGMLFAEDSDYGRFWGPQMSRLRRLLGVTITDAQNLLTLTFGGTRYRIDTMREFLDTLGGEIQALGSNRAPPGSLVFGPNPEDVGLQLPDNTVVGYAKGDGAGTFSPARFNPQRVWHPHL